MTDSVAQDQIRAFVDRILRLKEEAKSINGDIREVYAEAKGNGFDKTVLGKLVSYVEKRATGAADLQEAEALFDLYLSAYDGASHTHAREEASEADWQAMRQWASARIASGADEAEHDADGVIIESTAARKDVHDKRLGNGSEGVSDATRSISGALQAGEAAGTQAPPVDTITDLTQPNPICRDPSDCGVYASWHHPCLACKRAASVRAAA